MSVAESQRRRARLRRATAFQGGEPGHHAPPPPGPARAPTRRGRWIVALLCVWDAATWFGAVRLSGAVPGTFAGTSLAAALALAACLALNGAHLYRPAGWLRGHPLELLGMLAVAATAVAWAAVLLGLLTGVHLHSRALALSWLAGPLLWLAGRGVAALAWRRARHERILIVGAGEVAVRIARTAQRTGSVIVGCLDEELEGEERRDPPVIGTIEQLPEILRETAIDRLVVAFTARRDFDTLEVLRRCTDFHGTVDIVPRFFDFLSPTASIYAADGLPILSLHGRRITRGRALVKRAFDVVGAAALTLALSPVLCVISLAVLLDSGRPIFYRQRRIGMHGAPFRIVKFRTLSGAEPAPVDVAGLELTPESVAVHVERAKRQAAQRATPIGTFLRRTSMDELPQLFNVLLGHMSLVGPRPLSPLEDAVLDGWELLRREVRPGITGLWQVSGRSEVAWDDRVTLDYRQVRHWSLYADMRVLADTIGAVIRQRGAG